MAMENEFQVGVDELDVQEIISRGSLDFDSWCSLISDVEKTYPDDIEKISLVYDSFLSEYPLCYGYWRKYANHKSHLSTVDKAIKVYEQAVQYATYSVGVWVDYCSFSMLVFEDPFDVRRLFNRGLSFVGKDYLCHCLWDKYIEFEFSQQHWSSLAHIYIQALKFPTKKLHHYHDSFKKLTAIWEEEIKNQNNSTTKLDPQSVLDCEIPICNNDEILFVVKDLLDTSNNLTRSKALQKYIFIGEKLYKEACYLDEKIHNFEMNIRRPYFHVKPLDPCQIENWHHYLDFVEMHGDFNWAVKLYERCLISCANYPEFWMRYAEFVEVKGGREIANFALDRATKVFVKDVTAIHYFNARYKEQIRDTFGARAAFLKCNANSDSVLVENVVKHANMEKRLGNFEAACNIYNKAIEVASMKQKLQTIPYIYVNYSRLKYMITGSVDDSRDVLIDGIKRIPHSKLLLMELINFTMSHGGSTNMSVIDSIIFNAISQEPDESSGFSFEDKEYISNLYLELVDFWGTIDDVKKAWIRHRKLFPDSLRTFSSFTQPVSYSKLSKKTIVQPQLSKPDENIPERLQHESPKVTELSENAPNNSTAGVLENVVNDMQEDHGRRSEQDLNPISLENLTLCNDDNAPLDSNPVSVHKPEATPETNNIPNADIATPQQNDQNTPMGTCESQVPTQPVAYSQGQMCQYPTQNNDPTQSMMNMQYSQEYYQMWQYYYYQQQQQQYYQQQQQQQYYQQQQQYYQAQQMQQQQLLLYAQQQQNQDNTQAQQQIQQNQLPSPHLLQQLLQQQQWKLQQQQQEQGNQQQDNSSQSQTLDSYYQEFQNLTPPHGTPSGQAVSPHPQEQPSSQTLRLQ